MNAAQAAAETKPRIRQEATNGQSDTRSISSSSSDQSTETPPKVKNPKHQLKQSKRLFDVVSSRSKIDHPVCADCAELLLQRLRAELDESRKERDGYVDYLRQLQTSEMSDDERRQIEKEVEAARKDESKAIEELKAVEAEKIAVDEEHAKLVEESEQLDREEEEFWREYYANSLVVEELRDELAELRLKFEHDSKQLEGLQRTNVYNDAFCITRDGAFGVINGLRLGRLSSMPVEWSELSAAWGQIVLLLASVASRLSFTFRGLVMIYIVSRF